MTPLRGCSVMGNSKTLLTPVDERRGYVAPDDHQKRGQGQPALSSDLPPANAPGG